MPRYCRLVSAAATTPDLMVSAFANQVGFVRPKPPSDEAVLHPRWLAHDRKCIQAIRQALSPPTRTAERRRCDQGNGSSYGHRGRRAGCMSAATSWPVLDEAASVPPGAGHGLHLFDDQPTGGRSGRSRPARARRGRTDGADRAVETPTRHRHGGGSNDNVRGADWPPHRDEPSE